MRIITTEQVKIKGARYSDSFSVSSPPTAFLDAWGKQREPSPNDLVKSYERYCFTCANINVDGVKNARLRLYSMGGKAHKTKSYFPVKTKRVGHVQFDRLKRRKAIFASQSEVEEVVSHEFLNLWENPNPRHTGREFIGYSQLYQEIVGETPILYVPDKQGILQEWWVLPPQNCQYKYDNDTKELIGVSYGGKTYPVTYTPGTTEPFVIPFRRTNPKDPYGAKGISPLAAVFETVNLEGKYMATQAAILDNEGMPSVMLSPKEPVGTSEAARLEHRYNAKFKKGGNGRVFVPEEDMAVTPLNFPPKDLAALEVSKASKGEIALAYGIPPALLETQQFNRATLDASILLHVRQAIWPRLEDFEGYINKYVMPLYGEGLFVAFDDPSPESQEITAAYLQTLVGAPMMTPNEGRAELDLPPRPDGDNLVGMPGQDMGKPGTTTDGEPNAQPAEQGTGTATGTPTENVQATALNGAQIDSLVNLALSLAAKELPPDSVRALIAASFPTLTTQQIADIVNPLLSFKAPEPVTPPPGGNPPQPPTDEPPADDGKSLVVMQHKAQRVKADWKEPPYSPELEAVARKFFKKFRVSALNQIKKDASSGISRKAFVPLDQATDELIKEARPIIELFLVDGGKQLMQRVGFDPDLFAVTNPKVRESINKAAFDFADSTNKSTTLKLNEAIDRLREEMGDSLDEGLSIARITKRVNEIFDGLEKDHAKLIAQTESSRAHHEGLREAAKMSGVVKGFELLLSPDACPTCHKVAAENKRIGLDGHFIEGEGTYGNRLVPLHPGCRCAMLEVLDEE